MFSARQSGDESTVAVGGRYETLSTNGFRPDEHDEDTTARTAARHRRDLTLLMIEG